MYILLVYIYINKGITKIDFLFFTALFISRDVRPASLEFIFIDEKNLIILPTVFDMLID